MDGLKIKLMGKDEEIDNLFTSEAVMHLKCDVLHSKFSSKKQETINILTKLIDDFTEELICPVCLDTTQEPIYQCLESHLICSKCRPNVEKCPICQVPYNGFIM